MAEVLEYQRKRKATDMVVSRQGRSFVFEICNKIKVTATSDLGPPSFAAPVHGQFWCEIVKKPSNSVTAKENKIKYEQKITARYHYFFGGGLLRFFQASRTTLKLLISSSSPTASSIDSMTLCTVEM